MRKVFIAGIVTVGVLLIAWGCGGGGDDNGSNTPNETTIPTRGNASAPTGFSFDGPVTVKSGRTVRWVNQSAGPHNIVWDSVTPPGSPTAGSNIGTFSAGATSDPWVAPTTSTNTTYSYYCSIHGRQMSGTVTVTP